MSDLIVTAGIADRGRETRVLGQVTTPPGTASGLVLTADGVGGSSWLAGGGSSFYQTMQDEGVDLTQRAAMNFVGAGVTATDLGGVTTVTIPGGGSSTFLEPDLTSGSPITYTYTYVTAPDAGFPDGAFNKQNNGKVAIDQGLTAPRTFLPHFEYYKQSVYTDFLVGVDQYTRWRALGQFETAGGKIVGWQAADMVLIADLASAKTVNTIIVVGHNQSGVGIHCPTGFKVRAADDAAITVNVVTAFADVTTLTDDTSNNNDWIALLDVSATAAKRYWELTAHRRPQWLMVSEVVFCASAPS